MASQANPEQPIKAKAEIHSQFLSLPQPVAVVYQVLSSSAPGVCFEYACFSPSYTTVLAQATVICHLYSLWQYSSECSHCSVMLALWSILYATLKGLLQNPECHFSAYSPVPPPHSRHFLLWHAGDLSECPGLISHHCLTCPVPAEPTDTRASLSWCSALLFYSLPQVLPLIHLAELSVKYFLGGWVDG